MIKPRGDANEHQNQDESQMSGLRSRLLEKRLQPKRPPCVQVQILQKKFNDRAGTPFWHLKREEKDVLTATLLYTKYPLSTYQVADLLELFGVKVSASSVGRWPQRFGTSVRKISRRYKIRIPKVWHVDEKFVPHKRVPSGSFFSPQNFITR